MIKSGLIIRRLRGNEIDQHLSREIDRFTEDHGGAVFHEVAFNKIVSETFGTDFFFLLAHIKGVLVACCPCHSIKGKLVFNTYSSLSSYEVPYGGWIIDSQMVSIGELIHASNPKFNEGMHFVSNIEAFPGQQSNITEINPRKLKTVVLSIEDTCPGDVLNGFKKKLRNKIRRAETMGIEVCNLMPSELSIFFALSSELKARAGLVLRDEAYYTRIFCHYYELGKIRCLAAKHEGRFVSAIIFLANVNYTTAWVAGRVNDIPNNLYQNELLLWEGIKWGFEFGSRYFDFCGLDEVNLPHLARMKLSFSKDIRLFYAYDLKSLSFRIVNHMERLIWGKPDD